MVGSAKEMQENVTPAENRQYNSPLRMRRDRDDRNFSLFRAVAPENPISARRPVLSVSLEDGSGGVVRILKGIVLVRPQARMPGIAQKFLNAIVNLLEKAFRLAGFLLLVLLAGIQRGLGIFAELRVLGRGFLRPCGVEGHGLFPQLVRQLLVGGEAWPFA